MSPDLQKLASEVARVAAENDWDKYRKKAGIGTYTLAGLIFILPKIGPLKLAVDQGPESLLPKRNTFAASTSPPICSAPHWSALVRRTRRFANRDLDTGAPVRPGGYRLADDTYAKLLHRLVVDPHHTIPPGLKADILNYYADPNAPIHTKKNPTQWAQVQADLQVLQTMPVSNQPIATETE